MPVTISQLTVRVGIEQAAFVEYGTVKHGAQPFFCQALEKFTDGHLRAAQLALEGVFK